MKEKLVLTAIVMILLAAGITYAQAGGGGPPQVINVDGGVYYIDGSPAEKCTHVVVELYSAEGSLKDRKELCTGQYFPPMDQFYHRYKLALAGTQNEDKVVVRALGVSNESVAKDFTLIDITGPRPGLLEDLTKGVSYITRLIVPQEPEEGTPVQPPSEEEEGIPPPTPSEVAGISMLAVLIGLAAILVLLYARREKKKGKKRKGTVSTGPLLIGVLAAAIILSIFFAAKDTSLAALAGFPEAGETVEEGAPAVTEEPAGKPQFIVEGGFPTGGVTEPGEQPTTQQAPGVNVNNVSHGAVFGPGGEDIMNTTWSNWTYVSDATQANPCGFTCNPADGNCTYVNASLIKKSDGSLIDNKTICTMQGYPGVAQFYNQFKTILTGEDGASKSDYTINVTVNNGTLQGRNSTDINANNSNWTVYIIDVYITEPLAGVPPTWGDNQSSIPSNYDSTNISNFTIQWVDNGVIDTVLFESNFSGVPQNYTMTNFTLTYYSYTDVLPAGTFYWKSYSNDTEDNWNVSDTWYFTIATSDQNIVELWINDNLNQNVSITYPTQSNATATAVAGPTLYRNEASVSNPEVDVLGGGLYAYKANATGNQNYSANFTGVTYYLQVNTTDNPVDLYLNGQLNQNISVVYGASINSTGTGPDGISLYRNESAIPNGQDIVLGAGLYEYKVNSTGDQNYSANATGQAFYAVVNQTTPSVAVSFTPSSSETYGTTTTASCTITTGDSGATLVLFRNGTQVNSTTDEVSETDVLGAGIYNYTCVYSASQNYTSGESLDNYLTIARADPSIDLFLAINGTQGDVSITYPEASNVTGWSGLPSDQDLTFNLYRNGSLITSGNPASEIDQLGGGAYIYVYNTTGGSNYTSGSSTARTLTVNKTSNVVHLYLNDQPDQNVTIAYGTVSNATATSEAGTVYLYRDEVQEASGASPQSEVDVLAANPSGYAYKVNATGDQNYSDNSSVVFYLTITQAATSVDLYLNGVLNSNNTITYPTEANATAVCNQTSSNTTLYRDGSLVNFTLGSASELIRLGNNTYNYTAVCEGGQNYSSSTNTQFLGVLKGTPDLPLDISPSTTVTYPTTTTTTCSAVSYNNEVTASLFRNGSGVSEPETIELGAGVYEYICNNTETQNYTTSSNTSTLTVQQNTTNFLNLYINNGTLYTNQNVTITYGTNVTVQGSEVFPNSGTVNLYRNGTATTNPETSIILGAGEHSYKTNSTGNANYTANATGVTNYVIVAQATPSVSVSFTPSSSETYGTTTTASCTITTGDSGATLVLLRNGTQVNSTTDEVSETDVLGAGVYNYTCVYSASQNYSSGESLDNYLTISQANITATNMFLAINGTQGDVSITYPEASNVTGWSTLPSDQDLTFNLYDNDTGLIASGNPASDIDQLDSGVYEYVYNTTGGENYTAASSPVRILTVGKASNPVSLYLNDNLNSNDTITYGTQSNATGVSAYGTASLYRDGASVSNPEVDVLAAGIYAYKVNATGSANYSDNTTGLTYYLDVSRAASAIEVTFSPSNSETYGIQTTTTCGIVTGDPSATITLYRNGTSVASGSGNQSEIETLAAGVYNYSCVYSQSENYTTSSSLNNYLTISQASTTTQLFIDGAEANKTVTYGTQTNATAVTSALSVTLYRNGEVVSNPDVIVLGAGTYNYTAYNPGNENYSSSSATWWVTVDQAPNIVDLYINDNLNSNDTITYGTQSNATGTSTAGSVSLYRDDVAVSNPEIITLGGGLYAYKANATGNQNYSTNFTGVTYYLQVDAADNPVDLYLNGNLNQNITAGYGTSVNSTGTGPNGISLYRNESSIPNGQDIVLAAGLYEYKVNSTGNQNYSANATGQAFYATITQASPTVTVSFTPSSSETYGTTTTASCTITTGDSGATLVLLRNGTQVNSTTDEVSETDVLGAGVYNYTCVYSASQNYSSGESLDNYLTISQANITATNMFLAINGTQGDVSITYPEASNVTGWSTLPSDQDLTFNLYRNGSLITSGNPASEIDQLGGGTYEYAYNTTGGVNYTAASSPARTLVVNPANVSITLLLNGTDGDNEFMNNTDANFTAFTSASGLTIDLYTNFSDGTDKLWDSGASPLINITNMTTFGVFNFTAYFAGNQNYTENSTTHYATVSELRPFGPGNLTIILNKTSEEVILNWTLSNSTNVFNYVIYVTDDWSAGFNYSDPYTTVSNTTTNWTDPDSDAVDERYYVVRANNTYGQTDLNTYAVGKYNLKLYTDWNLISLPLLLFNESMDDVFYTADNGDIVERWDGAGQSYDRTDYFAGFGFFGDFTTIQVDRGYWYYSQKAGYDTTPFNVTIVGIVPTDSRSETIYNKTWSLLGWTSVTTKDLDNALTQAANGDLIELFDAVPDVFERTDYFGGFGWYGDFGNIEPGRGYWYYSQNSTLYNWTYQP